MSIPSTVDQAVYHEARLKEARANHIYWQRQCEVRTNPIAQMSAGLQMVTWKRKVEQIEAALRELTVTH